MTQKRKVAARVLKEALQMERDDRAMIAERLISSLDPEVEPEIERLWQLEIQKRLKDSRNNQVESCRGMRSAVRSSGPTMEIRVELHPEAAAELQQAIDWYNNQFPALGSELLTEFDHAIEMICQHPLAWPQHIEGTRRFLLHRFSSWSCISS